MVRPVCIRRLDPLANDSLMLKDWIAKERLRTLRKGSGRRSYEISRRRTNSYKSERSYEEETVLVVESKASESAVEMDQEDWPAKASNVLDSLASPKKEAPVVQAFKKKKNEPAK